MLGKLVDLRQVSQGGPEQWQGRLSDGRNVFARERHGQVRIDIEYETVHDGLGENAYDVLCTLFEMPAPK